MHARTGARSRPYCIPRARYTQVLGVQGWMSRTVIGTGAGPGGTEVPASNLRLSAPSQRPSSPPHKFVLAQLERDGGLWPGPDSKVYHLHFGTEAGKEA